MHVAHITLSILFCDVHDVVNIANTYFKINLFLYYCTQYRLCIWTINEKYIHSGSYYTIL